MVKLQHLVLFSLLFLSLGILSVRAQGLVYHLEHEWAKIWINQDGSIDLLYDILIVCDEGTLHWVEIGQPNETFTIGEAFDEYNNELATTDTSYQNDYKVRVDVPDLQAGESVRFNLTTNVEKMIYLDTETNVGMMFKPTWWEEASVLDLQVQVILPPGVTQDEVTTTKELWNGTSPEDDRLSIFWQRGNLSPNQRYTFGVSFPKEFVQHYETYPSWLQTYGLWIAVLVAFFAIIAVVTVMVLQKKPYLNPVLSVEALGVKRGLTAVEASYLLDLKPEMIVTAILYSLLKKRAVWVTSTKPSVKLEVMQAFKRTNPSGPPEDALRYYEIDFLNAVKEDGTLDEKLLAETITYLGRSVEEKLRGHCRRDTIDYYRKIVKKAWEQVERAQTSQLTSKLYDEQLLWLLLDPKHRERTQTVFTTHTFEPSPLWFWYWYSYQHYHPRPTFRPNLDTPTKAGTPPKIPGSEFADNIATAVENTSNNIVTNLEKFANAIIPTAPPPKTSHQPAHAKSSCVCACAACACACACVSCACACAGGGAG